MRILLVHNHYQQPGGEDQVFQAEGALLERHGHAVVRYVLHNDEVAALGPATLAARTLWSRPAYRRVAQLVRDHRIDLVHVHNTLPLGSPAVYWAARRAGAAVVQTLHNFRLVCPGALLLRDGRVCTDCVGRLPYRAVGRACYRGSRAASAGVAGMLATHRALGTWRTAVDRYIALTSFAREVFVRGGLPAERVVVKPNFLQDDPGVGPGGGGFALYVGRLSPEKGIGPLIEAWRQHPDLPPLKVVGDGPLASDVASAPVEALGAMPRERVLALMQEAEVLVCPSLAVEGMPMAVVEAFACGLPVVAPDHGAFTEMVDETTGRCVPPGDAGALAEAVRSVCRDAALREDLRKGARCRYEARYSAERNYAALHQIYHAARAAQAGPAERPRPDAALAV
ncbi:MAG: glycosyltransferase family 4 protein [Rubricoccaceae bacterium]|nr:glycosyltransferase family 4 protein [Rubricoccaceae bacterium]